MERDTVFGPEPTKGAQAWVAGCVLVAWWLLCSPMRWVVLGGALAVASNDVAWGLLWVMNTATVEGICGVRWLVRTVHGLAE